jgi:hypothetical protein
MALNFQAFIDDSVTAGGEFVLAGHIAPAEAWANFAKEWEELLPLGTRAKNGSFHFKMSEMAATPERMARVPAFYALIEKYVTLSVSCRMNLVDFAHARERVETIASRLNITINLSRWNNPYFVVFRILMDGFHARREVVKSSIPLDEQVAFYFDNQGEKSFILAAWDEYIAERDDEIRGYYGTTPRFENDQKFLPLQAADLWAWWVREWYEEDSDPLPDKMKAFDFGKWRGKKRPCVAFSCEEDHIVDTFQRMTFANVAYAQQDGKFILPDPEEDPLNDAGAAMVLADGTWADKRGLAATARLVSYGIAAVEPGMFGLGPVPAVKQALQRAGWDIRFVERAEINEAFAAIAIVVARELGLPEDIVNVEGGAVAHGHPIGATGAVLTTKLIHSMRRDGLTRGLVTLCIGGGQGIALAIETLH